MLKQCSCGHAMNLELRKVFYAGRVEIRHVPVFSCSACSNSEVLNHVAKDIKELIQGLGEKPVPRRISFARNNELADIIRKLVMEEEEKPEVDWQSRLELHMQVRINLLLDLYRYAESLKDTVWMSDIKKRLGQLSGFTSESVFTNAKI